MVHQIPTQPHNFSRSQGIQCSTNGSYRNGLIGVQPGMAVRTKKTSRVERPSLIQSKRCSQGSERLGHSHFEHLRAGKKTRPDHRKQLCPRGALPTPTNYILDFLQTFLVELFQPFERIHTSFPQRKEGEICCLLLTQTYDLDFALFHALFFKRPSQKKNQKEDSEFYGKDSFGLFAKSSRDSPSLF